ncbi:type II toxin-antitoxin system mRNA interferase toxin, RelE/StbE family [Candidatus Gracilibacteria bacterium]|nr:type II toxin-antitoxin system mRNA interferase toxin, RelE/StbE family [Candidatus Gracilibacteria bacterium]
MTREIEYTNKFKRLYKKLDVNLQEKVKQTILELQKKPFPEKLKVHKLSGKLSLYYSCSVDYSNRIIFEIQENGKILLLLVGNHSIYEK